MSQQQTTTPVIDRVYELKPQWTTMDSVNFDEDSTLGDEGSQRYMSNRHSHQHRRRDSKDTLNSFDLAMLSNEEYDGDENDAQDPLRQPAEQQRRQQHQEATDSHSEHYPLLQSQEPTASKQMRSKLPNSPPRFPDTPNTILEGWNLSNKPSFPSMTNNSNNQGSATAGTTTAELLENLEGPVSDMWEGH